MFFCGKKECTMKNTLNENEYAQAADVLGVEKAAVKAVV